MTGIAFWTDNTQALDNLGDTVQLEFSYMLFSDIVQQVGEYDWQVVDDLLDDITGRGHQAILRFRYTYPGYTAVSVPDSIANSASYRIMIDKVENQDTFLPDWSNAALQDFSLQFFVDFAARYDGDPRLAMLQVGFGSYAEYHLYDGPVSLGRNFPSKPFQESFFEVMIANFTSTQWSVSIDAANDEYSPLADNSALKNAHFALFDDSFMHETHSNNNAEYNRASWLFFGTDRYHASMLGGEFNYYSDYDQQHVLSLPNGPWGRSFESFAEQYNFSYIIGNEQYAYQSAARIKQASLATGYKFNIDSFAASSTQTSVTISNTGIAPIYYDAYPAIDGTRSPISLKGLLPGQSLDFEFAVGGSAPVLSIQSDHLVAEQSIEYSADL
ncbi:MAG: hypothetical protein JKY14_11770 [Paraglaciecola sp.]|nr:hypothetical protein [Paraglaciecola sp.]